MTKCWESMPRNKEHDEHFEIWKIYSRQIREGAGAEEFFFETAED